MGRAHLSTLRLKRPVRFYIRNVTSCRAERGGTERPEAADADNNAGPNWAATVGNCSRPAHRFTAGVSSLPATRGGDATTNANMHTTTAVCLYLASTAEQTCVRSEYVTRYRGFHTLGRGDHENCRRESIPTPLSRSDVGLLLVVNSCISTCYRL